MLGDGAVDWVVCGGESGRRARPMHPDWARSLRDQTTARGRRFFFKQFGEWRPPLPGEEEEYDCVRGITGRPPAFLVDPAGRVHRTREAAGDGAVPVVRVGRRRAGRELDGRTWDETPERAG
jgi:protein gp37